MSEKKRGDTENGQHGAKTTGKAEDERYWEVKKELNKKGIKLYSQTIFYDWCKACGICIAFCPKKVFDRNEAGKPVVVHPDDCNGCLFCELHCPDFAISITERYRDRRHHERK